MVIGGPLPKAFYQRGRDLPIGAYDTMIAGQALRRGLTVITAHADDFGRVDDLMWEDWAG